MIQRFKIENETDADFFLKDLLAKDENRSGNEIIVRANNLIPDETPGREHELIFCCFS